MHFGCHMCDTTEFRVYKHTSEKYIKPTSQNQHPNPYYTNTSINRYPIQGIKLLRCYDISTVVYLNIVNNTHIGQLYCTVLGLTTN
jgi:hypothetical protein